MASIPFQAALSLLSFAAQHPALQNLQKSMGNSASVPASAPPSIPPVPLSVPPSVPPSVQPGALPNPLPAIPPVPPAPINIAPTAPANISNPQPPSGTPASTPPSVSASSSCDNCHIRPKHFDGKTTHPFCSKRCAAKAMGTVNGTSSNTPSAAGNCDFCHNRPKYSDGTQTHPFCSKACAKSAKAAPAKIAGSAQRKSSSAKSNANGLCQAPGCQNPQHISPSGVPAGYCSMAHKILGETICLMCRQVAKQSNSHFCGRTCTDQAEKMGCAILEVPAGHTTFQSVADQFKASWRHTGTKCPPVRRVYKILTAQSSLANYDAYRAAVEVRGQFESAGRSAGNENRRWHGTRRECNFGDKGQTLFCSSATCSLCCIVRTSFDLSLFGKKTGWGRFGKGIYTSSTSSKSNDYSHNDCTSSLKAMLLNKVVVGKGYKMMQDSTSLTAPPPGYDSVLAEKGGSLNYDELVVYTNDAIRPSFLVMYDA